MKDPGVRDDLVGGGDSARKQRGNDEEAGASDETETNVCMILHDLDNVGDVASTDEDWRTVGNTTEVEAEIEDGPEVLSDGAVGGIAKERDTAAGRRLVEVDISDGRRAGGSSPTGSGGEAVVHVHVGVVGEYRSAGAGEC